ncbi:uncharacterized protein LOC101458505 [Ceratitis capitata]|uniref:uncharacterized protein LOC101458505 n=1 Tax=Ceratitis capitata TaxID=7213 RepID=UPI000329FBDA|nr:uncharacterized protein LOC101458505 [Ceratitis capitata]
MSDNGKTFMDADRAIQRDFVKSLNECSADIIQKYAPQGINWHYIPPSTPHMGGLWESADKSFKIHLKKTAASHKFTFEEFTTLLVPIEAVLNSKPLSAISQDTAALTALTPGHFIRGAPLMAIPEPNAIDLSLTNRWEKIKILRHEFSRRWKEEYLKDLQKRYKWKNPQRDPQPGGEYV